MSFNPFIRVKKKKKMLIRLPVEPVKDIPKCCSQILSNSQLHFQVLVNDFIKCRKEYIADKCIV